MLPRSIQTKKQSKNPNKVEIANQLRHLSLNNSNLSHLPTYSVDDARNGLYWLSLSLTPASLNNNTQVYQHVLRYDGCRWLDWL